jgi:hypothetical protein
VFFRRKLLWTNSDFDVGLMSAPGSSAEVQPHPILSPLYRRKRTQPAHGDPVLAAKLIDLAAHLKEQAGELPVPFTEAPDLQPKEKE